MIIIFFCDANFYNNNSTWYEPIYELFKEDYILYFKTKNIYYDANNLIQELLFQIKIPTTIDLVRNEIVYIYKDVYEFNIDQFGNCSEQLHTNFLI